MSVKTEDRAALAREIKEYVGRYGRENTSTYLLVRACQALEAADRTTSMTDPDIQALAAGFGLPMVPKAGDPQWAYADKVTAFGRAVASRAEELGRHTEDERLSRIAAAAVALDNHAELGELTRYTPGLALDKVRGGDAAVMYSRGDGEYVKLADVMAQFAKAEPAPCGMLCQNAEQNGKACGMDCERTATTRRHDAAELRNTCAELVDIYDDGTNNPPEARVYVEGAYDQTVAELRALLHAVPEGYALVPVDAELIRQHGYRDGFKAAEAMYRPKEAGNA